MNNENNFGKTIKKYRIEKNMTQKELCKLAGISEPELIAIENGKRKNPQAKTIHNLAKVLDIDIEILI